MGWWPIDPETGECVKDARSKLSRPPEFVLVNAVPGVDDSEATHYLGDGALDMAYSTSCEIQELLASTQPPTQLPPKVEAMKLLMDRVLPPSLTGLKVETADRLLQMVDELWVDVDDCYQFDWDRAARPAERKWVCEYAVQRLTEPGPDEWDEA
jgi:hypothetical protein